MERVVPVISRGVDAPAPARPAWSSLPDIPFYLAALGALALQLRSCLRIEIPWADSSVYLELARSLRDHGSYTFNYAPHVHFPPGLPAILAAVSAIFGDRYVVMLRLMPVFAFLGSLAVYHLVRIRAGRLIAAVNVLPVLLSPQMFEIATQMVGSDLPYFCAGAAALLLASHSERLTWWRAAVFALVLPAALLIRPAGLSLVLALALWTAWEVVGKRALPRPLKLLLPALLASVAVYAAWSLYVSAQPGAVNNYRLYLTLKYPSRPELGMANGMDYVRRVWAAMPVQAALLDSVVFAADPPAPTPASPAIWAPWLLITLGFIAAARRHGMGLMEWYFLVYGGLLLLWPTDEGVRIMLPVLPLALYYACEGVKKLAPPPLAPGFLRPAKAAAATLAVALALHAGARLREKAAGNAALKPESFRHTASVEAGRWLASHTPPDAVVMAEQVAIVYRASHRKIVAFPITGDPTLILSLLRRDRVQLLVVTASLPYNQPTEAERLKALLEACPQCFTRVFAARGFQAFRIEPAPPAAPATP
ncbi:MAG: glycosyltransferase family 39 protein [Acidobacteriia bacterium]|nr:glycosyltransferase family 39 protein [Terriglobia bacterium]